MIRGIVSGKGGVGKTTITVNLGLAMHRLGEEIIALDGDIKNPTLGLHLGLFKYNLTIQDVLDRQVSLLQAMYIHKTGLRYIPAHLSLNFIESESERLKNILKNTNYNLLIDSAPGINKESLSVMNCCDELLIVSEPYLPDITNCMKIIELAKEFNTNVKGIVINKVRKKEYELDIPEIQASTNTPVVSVIPFDENVLKSLSQKEPVINYNPYSKASVELFKLASLLSDKNYKVPSLLRLKRAFYFRNKLD